MTDLMFNGIKRFYERISRTISRPSAQTLAVA